MRLGADVIVFSRHLNDRTLTQSVGLLSYTYLSRIGLDSIVVPMVDYKYDMSTKAFQPLYRHGEEHFKSNLSIILQWLPFLTEAVLLKQFDDIGAHGRKVIVFNLWFTKDGILEFDFETIAEDIRLQEPDGLQKVHLKSNEKHIVNQYRYSFRVYLSIVEHHNIALDLKYPEFIIYRPKLGDPRSLLVRMKACCQSPRLAPNTSK